ncbi:MAG: hypothetical protein Q8P22_11195 [Chloroflexota bacterium]|nr:hypothetical protein [Chloroflexota bacterium]
MSAPAAERRRHAANLRRRLGMLAHHHRQRDPLTGKSRQAVKAGRLGGRKRAEEHPGGPRAFGLELALRRWYPQDGEP